MRHIPYTGRMATATSVRARVRAELVDEIKSAARRQLAAGGASGLSLRAVAREVGMVSSAVYRYFPSRDDLLTALIIDAYNAVGLAAETADAACRRSDIDRRWMATCRAIRAWAAAHLQEYGLVYGTPVPEYRAPEDTIVPATRVTAVLIGIIRDGLELGLIAEKSGEEAIPRVLRTELASVREFFGGTVTDDLLIRSLVAWTHLFGAISFELFGHRVGTVTSSDAFFDHEMRRIAHFVGLP
jgi:AcrR family transcriptional regulator